MSSRDFLNIKSTTHLIGHLLREIESSIGDVLSPLSERKVERNDQNAHKARIESAVFGLEFNDSKAIESLWKRFAGRDNPDGFSYRAHRDNLNAPRDHDEAFNTWWSEVLSLFDVILGRYEERYGKSVDYIDRLISMPEPSTELIKTLKKSLPLNHTTYSYFFGKLDSPFWISLLNEEEFFQSPYDLIENSEDNSVRGILWPQSGYLMRMARKGEQSVQRQVLEIMLAAGSTNNYFVHADFADAAIAMPADLAAKWAEHEIEWLKAGNKMYGFLEDGLGKLIAKLANEQQSAVALSLASEILAVLPDPEAEKKANPKSEVERIAFSSLKPQIRCEQYNYEEILKNNIPALVKSAPFETLSLLCGLLEKAVVYSISDGESQKPCDLTRIWRPAIEKHEQNHDYMIDGLLITAVRDTAENICKTQPDKIKDVVEKVEGFGWNVFKRIGLHLLRVSENPPLDMVIERLLNEELFDDSGFHHEYFHLIKKYFGKLPPDGKNKILGWIGDARRVTAYLAEHKDEFTPEQADRNIRGWQYRKLIPICESLEGEWKQRFDDLKKDAKDSDMPPDLLAYTWSSSSGSRSPRNVQELTSMSVEELVAFLKEWKPSGEWKAPTPDGLGLALHDLVAEQPEKYAAEIKRFMDKNMDPTYVRHLLSGFCQVVEKDKAIPDAYQLVLKLCKWVVDQPMDIRDRVIPKNLRDGFDMDVNWENTKREIARLFEKVFDDKLSLPFSLRAQAFEIIEKLTEDPEPDLEHEEKYGGTNMDPLTLSINTIRGKALHGLMSYAMWVCRNIKKENRQPRFDDAELQGVRQILDNHLDVKNPKYGKSTTDRAVYGQWLPQLMSLDAEWFRAEVLKIFPSEPELKPLREAAWLTYLTYGGLYNPVFDVISGIYAQEVKALAGKTVKEDHYRSAEHRLVEHVAILYARKKVDLAKDGLVDVLFRTAPETLTFHAIEFIGRSLFENDLKPDVVPLFVKLWEWRVNDVAGGVAKMPLKELSAFSWWFASGRCDPAWAFKYLQEALQRTGISRSNHFVFERMTELFPKYPEESMHCLRSFIDRNDDPWFLRGSRRQKGVWTLLEQAVKSDVPGIKDRAIDILNLLGSKGYLEFRELMPK